MTPLLGTKTPSALVGDKSGGDTRAARSLLSCALRRGMGRLWRGMGGRRTPRWQHGLSCSPDVRYFFWSEPGPPTMVFTKHGFPTHDFPPFPTISRHFPAPPPPSADQVSTRRPPFLVSRPDCRAARLLLSCALWRGMGRLWRGMGGGRPPRRQHGLSRFHETRDTNHGYARREAQASTNSEVFTKHESRDTKHETRITAFSSNAAAVGW